MARRRTSRDPLGLGRALSGLLLPGLVAAMALLAALALAGAEAAAGLAARWERGAQAAVTVQLFGADAATAEAARARIAALPGVAQAVVMDPARVAALLAPWLGTAPSLHLPGVIEVRLADGSEPPEQVRARLLAAAPGAEVEAHGPWVRNLAGLAASLQAMALALVALVAAVAAAVVAVATRAGLAARRDAIEVLHGLGASDGNIAGRFAMRVAGQAALGALAGTALALPALALLAGLAAPWSGQPAAGLVAVPADLPWGALAAVPGIAWLLGFLTAQATVRRWLQRLP